MSSSKKILLLLSITGLYTLWIIQYSFHYGRLLIPPTWDDVAYMNDAAMRLRALYTHGMSGFFYEYIQQPPHSPLSMTLGIISFGFFGFHDWAPYAGNAIILFIFLFFIDFLLDGASLLIKGLCFTLILCLPISAMTIHEFRPDIAAALFTIMGIMLIFRQRLIKASFQERILIGLCFGLAFLAKPTMFPYIGAVYLSALVASSVFEKFDDVLQTYSTCFFTTSVLIAPHYILNVKEPILYIDKHILGQSAELWQPKLSLINHLTYYFWGAAGKYMLGAGFFTLVGLSLMCALILKSNSKKVNNKQSLALLATVLTIYLVPTLNSVKSLFYGLFIQLFLIAFTMTQVQKVATLKVKTTKDGVQPPSLQYGQRILLITCGIAAAIGLYNYMPYDFRLLLNVYQSEADIRTKREIRIANEVFNEFRNSPVIKSVSPEHHKHLVFVTTAGYADSEKMQWFSSKEDLPFLFKNNTFSDNIEETKNIITKVAFEFVIASESKTSGVVPTMPSTKIADALLAWLKTDSNFKEIAKIPDDNGSAYYVFIKNKL